MTSRVLTEGDCGASAHGGVDVYSTRKGSDMDDAQGRQTRLSLAEPPPEVCQSARDRLDSGEVRQSFPASNTRPVSVRVTGSIRGFVQRQLSSFRRKGTGALGVSEQATRAEKSNTTYIVVVRTVGR